MIIDNTIILVSLTGVYYIENAFGRDKLNQTPRGWQWTKLLIYNGAKNSDYQYLRTNNLFSIRDLETNNVIIEKQDLIPLSIINSNYDKLLQKNVFVKTLDGRFILINKDSDCALVGQEMITKMPPVHSPEELKHLFDNFMFYNRYKFDYLTYDKER